MNNRKSSQQPHPRKWLTVRVTDDKLAGMADLNVSDYVRRRLNGDRPPIAQTAAAIIRKLRLTGGLPKLFFFSALRETGAPAVILGKHEETLRLSAKKTAALEKTSQNRNEDEDRRNR